MPKANSVFSSLSTIGVAPSGACLIVFAILYMVGSTVTWADRQTDLNNPTAPPGSSEPPPLPDTLEGLSAQETIGLGRIALERRDRMVIAKEARVAEEAICESVEKLIYVEMFGMALMFQGSEDPSRMLTYVYAEPRVRKLAAYREPGLEPERRETLDCIARHAERYLHQLPLYLPDGQREVVGETVISTLGIGAAAIVLAELDTDGSHLDLVASLHSRSQEAHLKKWPEEQIHDSGRYINSFDGTLFCEAEKILLDRIVARYENGEATFPGIEDHVAVFSNLCPVYGVSADDKSRQRRFPDQADIYWLIRDVVDAKKR